jgi:hypothetical protein
LVGHTILSSPNGITLLLSVSYWPFLPNFPNPRRCLTSTNWPRRRNRPAPLIPPQNYFPKIMRILEKLGKTAVRKRAEIVYTAAGDWHWPLTLEDD